MRIFWLRKSPIFAARAYDTRITSLKLDELFEPSSMLYWLNIRGSKAKQGAEVKHSYGSFRKYAMHDKGGRG